MLQKTLEAKGLAVPAGSADRGARWKATGGRVRAVRLKSGEELPADLVVMAVGIRPNTALAESAGLHCHRGIVVNDTMQTFDPRIYAVGECASHRGTAYGLVAPLFEMAKVCANHLAEYGIARYTGSVTSTKLKVTGVDLFSAGDFSGGEGTEDIVLADPGARRLQEARHQGRQARRRRALRRHRGRHLVLQAAARRRQRRAHPRPPHVRRVQPRRRGPPGPEPGAGTARHRRGVRLQRRVQGRDREGDQGQGPLHARGRAQAHQGVELLRLVHGPGRADPHVHRRRRLFRGAEEEGGVRLHRPHAPGGARRHPRAPPAHDPGRLPLPRVAHAQRLRLLPAGDELLPAVDLAARGEGRPAVALHQRALARQHPEGRHLLGDPAHVGRRDHRPPSCAASRTSWTSTPSRR